MIKGISVRVKRFSSSRDFTYNTNCPLSSMLSSSMSILESAPDFSGSICTNIASSSSVHSFLTITTRVVSLRSVGCPFSLKLRVALYESHLLMMIEGVIIIIVLPKLNNIDLLANLSLSKL